jgi:hypothetical protein
MKKHKKTILAIVSLSILTIFTIGFAHKNEASTSYETRPSSAKNLCGGDC